MKKFLVTASLLFLMACGSATQTNSDMTYSSEPAMGAAMEAPMSADMAMVEKSVPPIDGGVAGSGSTAPLNPGERLVIRDAYWYSKLSMCPLPTNKSARQSAPPTAMC